MSGRTKTVELGPDELVIRRSDLKDMRFTLREARKENDRALESLDRRISGLLGEL